MVGRGLAAVLFTGFLFVCAPNVADATDIAITDGLLFEGEGKAEVTIRASLGTFTIELSTVSTINLGRTTTVKLADGTVIVGLLWDGEFRVRWMDTLIDVFASDGLVRLSTSEADGTDRSDDHLGVAPSERVVSVAGGGFRMGATGTEQNEAPVRSVSVDGFRMMATETTFEQYDRYAAATGTRSPSDFGWGRGDRPVVDVSWYDAVRYANWLSERDGLTPAYRIGGTTIAWNRTADGWRLPTEAEWEYAARGGIDDDPSPYAGGYNVDTVAWAAHNSGAATHPVGEKEPNELGLYDMSGNCWEWVWDRYGGYPTATEANPAGPASGTRRVRRGGSWLSDFDELRVAARMDSDPADTDYTIGFRLVRNGM